MKITKLSPFSGKTNTLNIDITQKQLDSFNGGECAQIAFPKLSASDREFMITGVTSKEWNEAFPPEESEPEDPCYE